MIARFVQLEDLEDILAIEFARTASRDEDFDVPVASQWAVDSERLLEMLKLRDSNREYVYRIAVVEDEQAKIRGAFAYEKSATSYEVSWFVCDPEEDTCEIIKVMGQFLTSLMVKSSSRKEVRVYLRDSEEAHLSEYLPAWKVWLSSQDCSWEVTLKRDYFSNPTLDGWCVSWKTDKNQGRRKAALV